jgi:hypothetical protein
MAQGIPQLGATTKRFSCFEKRGPLGIITADEA